MDCFLYERSCLVNVNWNSDDSNWNVNAYQFDDDNWNAGNRVIRKTFSFLSLIGRVLFFYLTKPSAEQ